MKKILTLLGTVMVLVGFALYVVGESQSQWGLSLTRVYSGKVVEICRAYTDATGRLELQERDLRLQNMMEAYANKFTDAQNPIRHIAVSFMFCGALLAIYMAESTKRQPNMHVEATPGNARH
jgi:hypothetical protein